jgi:putative FmdB family regulatory protein
MPIYEYQCETCDHCFEILIFSGDDDPTSCPQCNHQPIKRVLSAVCRPGASDKDGCSGSTAKGFS